MKKTYNAPCMEIVKIQTAAMLAGSMDLFEDTVDEGNVLIREVDDDFWDYEEDY